MNRLLAIAFVLSACAPAAVVAPPAAPAPTAADLELVETAPLETTLDHADVRDAADVWPEMLDRAKHAVAIGEFYASDGEGTTRLAPTLAAIERATKRGVVVRFIADAIFAPKYPETLARLRAAGATVRAIDAAHRYGGIQHAKYIVVDDSEAFVGSQNFDWRALAHIHEMGVHVRSAAIAGSLLDVFDTDWALADPATAADARVHAHPRADVTAKTGESISLWASPKGWLPDESRWDLPHLVGILDGARKSIAIQVLTYSTENRDKSAFTTLDDAIRRAAGRGVPVRLLVSHWGTNAHSAALRSVEALATVPNVDVRVIRIPAFSGGEIPYARVAHAKYLVADDHVAWVGTSNWEGDYFLKSRNLAVVMEGGKAPDRLLHVFEDAWTSAYTTKLGVSSAGEAAPRPSDSGSGRR